MIPGISYPMAKIWVEDWIHAHFIQYEPEGPRLTTAWIGGRTGARNERFRLKSDGIVIPCLFRQRKCWALWTLVQGYGLQLWINYVPIVNCTGASCRPHRANYTASMLIYITNLYTREQTWNSTFVGTFVGTLLAHCWHIVRTLFT